MDLSTLTQQKRDIEIVHPVTGENLGVRVTLLPLEDQRMKDLKRKFIDERLRLERRGKGFKAEDLESNTFTLLFAAMSGWEWYGKDVNFNGTKPEFSRAKVKEVFEALPWFREQIDEELADDKAFFQA